jgi:hypothetical protein
MGKSQKGLWLCILVGFGRRPRVTILPLLASLQARVRQKGLRRFHVWPFRRESLPAADRKVDKERINFDAKANAPAGLGRDQRRSTAEERLIDWLARDWNCSA